MLSDFEKNYFRMGFKEDVRDRQWKFSCLLLSDIIDIFSQIQREIHSSFKKKYFRILNRNAFGFGQEYFGWDSKKIDVPGNGSYHVF